MVERSFLPLPSDRTPYVPWQHGGYCLKGARSAGCFGRNGSEYGQMMPREVSNSALVTKMGRGGTDLESAARSCRVKAVPQGIILPVRVQPRASQACVVGIRRFRFKVKVCSPPTRGEANEECLQVLGKWLGVRASQMDIVRGATMKNKSVQISGDSAELLALLRQRIGTGG